MLVEGTVRVAVRTASRKIQAHHATVGGKVYTYRYPQRQWNFHSRNKLPVPLPDYWILTTPGERDVFVVPSAVLGGVKDCRLYDVQNGSRRRSKQARVWSYLNKWDVLRQPSAS